ncbi:hypothetical protein HPP92_020265 [Vanilla planifolia]|uniref:Uncharacterized protein n=1 Tax=Vanilla planifolia TaxID=51239 RepID=A0A835Q0Y4_VANPL|nr:hypothetical protein HPP92_020265 [Vanilla planifolia]
MVPSKEDRNPHGSAFHLLPTKMVTKTKQTLKEGTIRISLHVKVRCRSSRCSLCGRNYRSSLTLRSSDPFRYPWQKTSFPFLSASLPPRPPHRKAAFQPPLLSHSYIPKTLNHRLLWPLMHGREENPSLDTFALCIPWPLRKLL